jgi:tetratricopeptide (TPR) repeat protein
MRYIFKVTFVAVFFILCSLICSGENGIFKDKVYMPLKLSSHYADIKSIYDESVSEAEYYFNLGIIAFDNKKYNDAIKFFTKSIELDPYKPATYLNRGVVYLTLNNLKAALKDFDKAIEINPLYTEAYVNRGSAYILLEDYDNAILSFNEAIKLNPNDAVAYFMRAQVYQHIGEIKLAENDFNMACQLDNFFCFNSN